MKMNFSFGLLQILFLATVTTKFLTVAMTCDKLIDSGSIGNIGAPIEVMETGRYEVRTFARTNSAEVRSLVAELDGASDIQYKVAWFTAILQPKDLKKVTIVPITCTLGIMHVYS